MNKFYGKISYNRPKINRYPPYTRGYSTNLPREKNFYRKMLQQIGICILLVLLAILIKTINTPITNRITETIKLSLSSQMDAKSSIGKLKAYVQEIPKLSEKAITVFQKEGNEKDLRYNFILPITGEVKSSFGQSNDGFMNTNSFQRGIDIKPDRAQNILAIEDGEILEIGESSTLGKYIQIKHENNIISLYAKCSEIDVQKGETVMKGSQIGRIHVSEEQEYFHFELWVNGNVVDPLQFMDYEKKSL